MPSGPERDTGTATSAPTNPHRQGPPRPRTPKSVQRRSASHRAPTRGPGSCDAARPADPPWIRPSARRRANPSIRPPKGEHRRDGTQQTQPPRPPSHGPTLGSASDQPPDPSVRALGPLHEEPTPPQRSPTRAEASRHAPTGRETPQGRRRNVNQRNPPDHRAGTSGEEERPQGWSVTPSPYPRTQEAPKETTWQQVCCSASTATETSK